MKNKILFIGANSRIVKSLNVPNAAVISHAQIDSFTFDEYSEIFLFSWSNYSLEQNLELINKLPRSKIIFISTVAVFATFFKQQWNNYPNWKLVCERHVLSRGGKVVRFGIFDEEHLNKLNNLIPHTTSELIESYIRSSNKQVITNLFYLKPIDRNRKLQGIESFINIVSSYLPGKFIFQAPFELILKLLGSKYYGYTYHCLRFFRQNFQVGY